MNICVNPAIKQKTNNLSLDLYEYIHTYFGLNEERYAWKLFSGWDDEEVPPSRTFLEIFSPWYLYSYVNEFGETFATTYLYEHENKLCEIQKQFIQSATKDIYSFYKVLEVEPGQNMEILDLLTKKKFLVFENLATKTLRPGDIIFSKLAEVSNLHFLLGTSSEIITSNYLPMIEKFKKNRKLKNNQMERITLYFEILGNIYEIEEQLQSNSL